MTVPKTLAIEALKDILCNGPTTPCYGLCSNLIYSVNNLLYGNPYTRAPQWTEDFITSYAPQWEGFSGNEHYPIPASIPKDETPEQCYDRFKYLDGNELWEGCQLEYRTSLIKFIIKELEKNC